MNKKGVIGIILLVCVYIFSGIPCPIKLVTGISCGGCGMTRAVKCLLSGDFGAAFHYHPLVLVFPVYFIILFCKNKIGEKTFKTITQIFLLLVFAVYFIRIFNPLDEVVTADIKDGIIYKMLHYAAERRFI